MKRHNGHHFAKDTTHRGRYECPCGYWIDFGYDHLTADALDNALTNVPPPCAMQDGVRYMHGEVSAAARRERRERLRG